MLNVIMSAGLLKYLAEFWPCWGKSLAVRSLGSLATLEDARNRRDNFKTSIGGSR